MDRFKYDVALSYLKADEGLALQVSGLLQDRIKTIAAPGEGSSILYQARIVVVLYRDRWGAAGNSLSEETAIRERAHEEGYDFILFIPLEASASGPPWLPKKQIWSGFKRWGAEGIGAVVEARVEQAGGGPPGEALLDHARRIERERLVEEERQRFLHSPEGVCSARSELSRLFAEIEAASKEIKEGTEAMPFRSDRDEKHLVLSTGGLSLDLDWISTSPDTLERSSLQITLWKGLLSVHGAAFEKPRRLNKAAFSFDRTPGGELGWRESEGKGRFLTSEDLAEESMNLLLDRVSKG